MIDFSPIHDKELNWQEFSEGFTKQDLIDQTNRLTDTILEIIAGCTDKNVVFQPVDPDAHDPYSDNLVEEDLAWTLGHVIVHITASNEESAFLAAELARGVEVEPRRSRVEVPWEAITTIQQCRQRLEESRRMLLGSLEMWPDAPDLENYYQTKSGLKVTPRIRFLFGQSHADGHVEQIEEIVRQAKAAG